LPQAKFGDKQEPIIKRRNPKKQAQERKKEKQKKSKRKKERKKERKTEKNRKKTFRKPQPRPSRVFMSESKAARKKKDEVLTRDLHGCLNHSSGKKSTQTAATKTPSSLSDRSKIKQQLKTKGKKERKMQKKGKRKREKKEIKMKEKITENEQLADHTTGQALSLMSIVQAKDSKKYSQDKR
jgi:hypothetical protein